MKSSEIRNRLMELFLTEKDKKGLDYIGWNDMEQYLSEHGMKGYTPGQLNGVVYRLKTSGVIKSIGKGKYVLAENNVPTETARRISNKKCFFIYNLHGKDNEVNKDTELLYKYIVKPICEEYGYTLTRIDEVSKSGNISPEILDTLRDTDLVIADVSDIDINISFMLGYRSHMGEQNIYLYQKKHEFAVDKRVISAYSYDVTDLENVEETKKRLIKNLKAVNTYIESDCNSTKKGESKYESDILSTIFSLKDDISKLIELNRK